MTSTSSAWFEFAASEPATFSCSLDGGSFAPCLSPAFYAGLTDATHTFAVRATDFAGNDDQSPATRAWVVDTTPPDTEFTSTPHRTTTARAATFVLSSPDVTAAFECSLDGAPFAACADHPTVDQVPLGRHEYTVRAVDAAGNRDETPATYAWEIVDAIVVAAGDIACPPETAVTTATCHHEQTSDVVMGEPEVTTVLGLGDMQYEDGCYDEFMAPGAYDETWGRMKAITRPAPGNHEYHASERCPPAASGYHQYFGAAAGAPGKGYYSFDLGSWHIVSLNSNVSAGPTSPQGIWLASDLAAATRTCTLAYWHRPRYSSGSSHGDAPAASTASTLWNAAYDAGVDVVLVGHEHSYERFAPRDKAGQQDDARGIRQFVVGTGGADHGAFVATPSPTSEVREGTTFGVLKLTLRPAGYDWEFVPEAGRSFTDSGSSNCH